MAQSRSIKLQLTLGFVFGPTFLLGGCAHKLNTADSNIGVVTRAPATLQDPPGMYLPGMPTPSAPGHGSGKQPTMPNIPQGAMTEGLAGCKLNLSQVALGGTYSVGNALFALRTNSPMSNGRMSYGSFTGDFDLDRRYLRPWFEGTNFEYNLQEMGRRVPAFKKALGFVFGPLTDCASSPGGKCTQEDYLNAHRFAVILASAMAVSSDAECLKYVLNNVGKGVLGPFASELDAVPLTETAAAKRDGTLKSTFEKTHKNKVELDQKIESVQKEMEKLARDDGRAIKGIQRELKNGFRELKILFSAIPPCAQIIDYETRLLTDETKEQELIDKIMDECESKIQSRLSQLANDEAKIRNQKEDQNPERERKLADIKSRTEKLKGFLDLLTKTEVEGSIIAKVEAMNALLKKRGELQNNPIFKEKEKAKNLLESRLNDLAGGYVTQGYLNRLR